MALRRLLERARQRSLIRDVSLPSSAARAAFYAECPRAPQRQKHSAAIGRVLKRLQVRGIVSKVPRTRRWRVTEEGRRVLGDTLLTYRRYQAQAA